VRALRARREDFVAFGDVSPDGKKKTAIAIANIEEYLKLLPTLKESPGHLLWSSYDAEADTLYINFKKPSHATDSDMTDDDVIVRYENGEIVGLTILHASKR